MLYSLKWKIQLWHAPILGLVLCLLGVGFYHYEKARRLAELDQLLDQELPPLVLYSVRVASRANASVPLRRPRAERNLPPGGGSPGDERPPQMWLDLLPPADERPAPLNAFKDEPVPEGWEIRQTPFDNLVPDEERRSVTGPGLAYMEDVLEPRGFYAKVINPNTREDIYQTENFPDIEFPDTHDPCYLVRTREGKYRELHHVNGHASVIIGCDLADFNARLHVLKFEIFAGAFVIFLLGVGIGYIVVGRALWPLRQIETTVGEVAKGDLRARIPEVVKGRSSELSLLAANMNNTFAQLESLFQRQIRFTADASHELRTPLTVLLAQLELSLKKRRSPEEYENALNVCLRSTNRVLRITSQLIELSRYDSGQMRMDRQEMPLDILLRDLAEELEPYVHEHKSLLQVDLEPGVIECDPFRLEQVINNLVNNALQHNTRPLTIGIRLRLDKEAARIEITDDGKGIQPENLSRLFDRFFQESSSRTKSRGTENVGLGLAICKAIIDAHGGTLEVASVPEQKTTFTIILPRSVPGCTR